MEKGLIVALGMTISYLFSLAGMIFAWIYYRRNKKLARPEKAGGGES